MTVKQNGRKSTHIRAALKKSGIKRASGSYEDYEKAKKMFILDEDLTSEERDQRIRIICDWLQV
jgi:hypothetical protein